MAISFTEWVDQPIESEDGTIGGTTYYIGTKTLCYNFLKSHYRVVRLLTGEPSGRKGRDYLNIKDEYVQSLVNMGEIVVDTSDCVDGFGWLGCKVSDTDGFLIGVVGDRCGMVAGYGTEHVGTGRCKLHGGADILDRASAITKDGLSSRYLKRAVQDKIDKYRNDPAPIDLTNEIATSRALLEYMTEEVLEDGDREAFLAKVPSIIKLMDTVGRQVDRAAAIERRYAMTAAQVIYVQRVFVGILDKYVYDPSDRASIAAELAQKLGTSIDDVGLSLHASALPSGRVE